MNKYEFLEQLEDQLHGSVSSQELMESVQYYSEYIDEEIRRGKTEEEVLDSLGSPNSIAKSIIDARGMDEESDTIYDAEEPAYEEQKPSAKVFHMEGWQSTLILIGIVVVIFLILAMVFKVVAILLPFAIPFALILFLIKMVTGRK